MSGPPPKAAGLQWLRLAPVMLGMYWVSLFIGAHIPLRLAINNGYADKLEHLAAFAGLNLLLLAVWSSRRSLGVWQFVQAVAVLGLYGAFDEISQIPVGRDCELLDWVADLVGALIGAVTFNVLAALVRRVRRTSVPT